MHSIKKYIRTLLHGFVLLQTMLLCSCHILHEDMSDCDLYLKFRYDYNMSYEDWFREYIDEVKVFVFDRDDRFVKVFKETSASLALKDFKLQIPFQMKGYKAVVWAGKTDLDYILPQMSIGDKIEKLTLSYQPENNVSSHQIASLWHSGPDKMIFLEANGLEQTISLTRNTNDFQITLQSNGTLVPISNYDIQIKGANGSYDCKNDFLKEISTITYRPAGDNQQIANIYTMRLVKGSSLTISAQNTKTGDNILIGNTFEANLTELLLKGKPQDMGEQEYLDRRYIWDISLNYNTDTNIAINITINGWVYWFQNTDL